MKNSSEVIPLLYVLLILLVALLSWVGGVYGWGLVSLLDADGVRWLCTHVLDNVRQSPWLELTMALAVCGQFVESGLPAVFTPRFWQRHSRTLKKMRALQITIVVLAVMVVLFVVSLTGASPLMSALGQFTLSPLFFGLYPISLLVLLVLGTTYGLASGRFYSVGDVVRSVVSLPVAVAPYFFTLFLAAQLMGCIRYVWALSVGSPADILLCLLLYGIPLILSLLSRQR